VGATILVVAVLAWAFCQDLKATNLKTPAAATASACPRASGSLALGVAVAMTVLGLPWWTIAAYLCCTVWCRYIPQLPGPQAAAPQNAAVIPPAARGHAVIGEQRLAADFDNAGQGGSRSSKLREEANEEEAGEGSLGRRPLAWNLQPERYCCRLLHCQAPTTGCSTRSCSARRE